jgi:hypothetical protein
MRATDNQAGLIGYRENPESHVQPFEKPQGRLVRPVSYAMPPGVPRDRVRAVQAAVLKTLKDPELVAEAEKTRMTLNPIPGTTLHNMIVEGLSMIRGYVAGKLQSRYLYS